jgi:hypothetical protein
MKKLSVIGCQLSGVAGRWTSVVARHLTVIILILLSLPFLQPTFAAEKAPFDAYAWYLPYGQVVRVNCQFSKEEAAKLEGKKTEMSIVVKSQDGKTVLDKSFPFEMFPAAELVKRVQFKQPLPDGNHTATVQIRDSAGAVLQSAENPIVVRKYAFEHNNIGKERVVIPPFDPVTANANLATVWGRRDCRRKSLSSERTFSRPAG